MKEHLLTLDDVAKRLQVTRRTVLNYVRSGDLPSVRISAQTLRVRAEDLEAFIESARTQEKST